MGDELHDLLAAGGRDVPQPLRARILSSVDELDDASAAFQLAQMNIARFRTSIDDPAMSDFMEMLDPLNHQAEASPGFVWRLTDEGSNNATSIAFYDDPLLLVNMSVWQDLQSLRDYVYRAGHAAMMKRREEWADALETPYIVLWWVPLGHRPTIAEGDERLRWLHERGPTADAFTFGRSFPAPT